VAVRMAVLYLLAGAHDADGSGREQKET
jgi:hypothetical protein